MPSTSDRAVAAAVVAVAVTLFCLAPAAIIAAVVVALAGSVTVAAVVAAVVVWVAHGPVDESIHRALGRC